MNEIVTSSRDNESNSISRKNSNERTATIARKDDFSLSEAWSKRHISITFGSSFSFLHFIFQSLAIKIPNRVYCYNDGYLGKINLPRRGNKLYLALLSPVALV